LVGLLLLVASAASALDLPGAGRVTANGYLDGRAVAETEGGSRQRPQLLGDVALEARPSSSLSARLEMRGRMGGPFEGGPGVGVYDFADSYQNRSPAVEFSEAWAEWRGRRAEVRLGIQKFVWGKLDGIPPTDVLNPRDFHDPLVDDYEERKIGIPGVLGTYYLPDVPGFDLTGLRASLAWIPFAVPSRLALIQERWFPHSVAPPSRFVLSKGILAPSGLGALAPLSIPIVLDTTNRRAARQLDEGGLAFRLGGTWRESDWDLYHYTGPETGPDLDLRVEAFADKLDVGVQPPNIQGLRLVNQLTQANDHIHMTGADWAMPVGGFTMRAEAAWFIGRPYLQLVDNLISPQRVARLPIPAILARLVKHGRAPVSLGTLYPDLDSVDWGVGTDYVWNGWQPLVQVNQTVFVDDHPTLLLNDPETRLSGTVRKRVLGDRLEFEVRGVYGIERESWLLFPRVSYRVRDDLRLRLGYLAIGGPQASAIGQFRANDEVVMQARYSF
jgi:hypothetical protein